jgi:hypothetical protein
VSSRQERKIERDKERERERERGKRCYADPRELLIFHEFLDGTKIHHFEN